MQYTKMSWWNRNRMRMHQGRLDRNRENLRWFLKNQVVTALKMRFYANGDVVNREVFDESGGGYERENWSKIYAEIA